MARVGIVGFGFMGQMHFRCYQAGGAKVVALCDADESKLKGDSKTAGNVGGTEEALDLAQKAYDTFLKRFGPDHPHTKTAKSNLEGIDR